MSPDSVALMEREGLRIRPALPEPPASVRRAGPTDEIRVFEFLVQLWKHNDNGWGYPYRPEKVLAQIEAATRPNPEDRTNPTDQRKGLIGLIEEDGKIVASVGLYLDAAAWFSDQIAVFEVWMHVHPEARKARYEAELRQYAKWVKARLSENLPRPLPLFTGFHHRGPRFKAMLRLWRRWGGELCGALFVVD